MPTDYAHAFAPPAVTRSAHRCRCGASWTPSTTYEQPPKGDCPAAMAERIAAYETELAEVDQLLGRALGYPPNPDGAPGVCTGEHTPVTLAMTAAGRIAELEATLANERGEGDPPCEGPTAAQRDEGGAGLRYTVGGDGWWPEHAMGGFAWWRFYHGGIPILQASQGLWVPLMQGIIPGPGTQYRRAPEPTFRSAMRAATQALRSPRAD